MNAWGIFLWWWVIGTGIMALAFLFVHPPDGHPQADEINFIRDRLRQGDGAMWAGILLVGLVGIPIAVGAIVEVLFQADKPEPPDQGSNVV